jgi:type I restriction enzyme S subunit
MKYQTYPAYKDSGVEWLGDVPEHWDVWKLNHFSPIITCGVAATPDYIDDGVIFLSAQNVKNRSVDLSKGFKYISKEKHSELTKNRAPKNGDILLSRVGTVGEVCIVDVDFEFSIFVSLTHLRLNQKICTNRFFVFLCESTYTKSLHSAVTLVGGGVGNLNVNDLKEYRLPLPALSEQQKIAQFLDHETAKIDTLIEKQQRLIELLKEKRQAVISHAVTKGLNPNAPMKESGVEWLGDVPEHWEVIQSRRLFFQRKERARPDDEQLTASQKHGVIFQKEYMELENQRVVQVITGSEILKHVEPNDFVISMRSFQGGLEWCKYAGSVSSAYIGLIAIKHVVPEFFAYLFKSNPYIQALQSTSNLVRDGQALRFENFSQVNLLKIPDDEQILIADFLNQETNKIDVLILKAQKGIELMQERRTALISAAVTGKIDVRHWGD